MVAEIFMGRIRVSYDVGNSPGSVMFSYDTVNDGKMRGSMEGHSHRTSVHFLGKIHELQLISVGQNFSLTVDRGYTRHINNRGQQAYLNTSEIDALYVGGLPNVFIPRALQLWHIREATSFQGKTDATFERTKDRAHDDLLSLSVFTPGCIHGLYINDDAINFVNVDYRHKILPGCVNHEHNQSSCSTETCQHGQCRLEGFDYQCMCHEGFSGSTCSQGMPSSSSRPIHRD